MPLFRLLTQCPFCKSNRVHRLRLHNLYEHIRGIAIVPVRCDTCCREFLRLRLLAPKVGARLPERNNILINTRLRR